MIQLPDEIIRQILSYLNKRDIISYAKVKKSNFRKVTNDAVFWYRFFRMMYPSCPLVNGYYLPEPLGGFVEREKGECDGFYWICCLLESEAWCGSWFEKVYGFGVVDMDFKYGLAEEIFDRFIADFVVLRTERFCTQGNKDYVEYECTDLLLVHCVLGYFENYWTAEGLLGHISDLYGRCKGDKSKEKLAINLIKFWITNYSFSNSFAEIEEKFDSFLVEIRPEYATSIHKLLPENPKIEIPRHLEEQIPDLSLLDYDTNQVAEQFAMFCEDYFLNFNMKEFSIDEFAFEDASLVSEYIGVFHQMKIILPQIILGSANSQKSLEFFLHVCSRLIELECVSGLKIIFPSILNNVTISIFRNLPIQELDVDLTQMHDLAIHSEKSLREYEKDHPNALPSLTLVISDLFRIIQTTAPYSAMLGFDIQRAVLKHKIVRNILRTKKVYTFEQIPELQQYFKAVAHLQ